MQHFLDINQLEQQQLRGILDDATRIKTARAGLSKGTLDAEQPLSLIHTDAADDLLCVDLGGRRIIKKKKKK